MKNIKNPFTSRVFLYRFINIYNKTINFFKLGQKLFSNIDKSNFDEDEFERRFKESLDNSFLIFTGQRTYSEIIVNETKSHFFFFDPEKVPTKEDVQDLMDIYEEYEEYEKCGELLNLITKNK